MPSASGPTGAPPAGQMLAPAFRRFFWRTYDNLGLLVPANLLWIALLIPVVTAPAATAALFHLARMIARREPVGIRDFFSGFRIHFLPALKLGAFDLAIATVIWVNIDFYSRLGGPASIPGVVLAGLFIWAGVFVLLMHAHLYPLLVEGERSLKGLLRKSALLTLDNMAFTIGLTVQALLVIVICVLTGAFAFLVMSSAVAVLLISAYQELLRRYLPPDPAQEEPPETRGFRDLWRPWETREPQ